MAERHEIVSAPLLEVVELFERLFEVIAATVDAHGATSFGGDEPELLVVAHGSVGDPELVGNLRDRPGSRVARRCRVAQSTHKVHRGALVMFVRMLYVYVNVK